MAPAIITVSNTERSTIIQKYPELREKLRVVYNAVGTSFQNSDPKLLEKIKKKYELPDKFIFCLGNTSPKKNLSNILKAYYLYLEKSKEKLPLVLADHSPGDLFLFLNSNQSQHKENLKFIGYIRNSEMPYLYQLSHLFLYPSIRESFGIPILESMKMSTPVITSNISCMPEIAGRGAYYADPFDENSIATAMEELLQNPTLYKSMVDRGHQRVAEFSWRESAKKLLEIYENVYAESYPKKLKTKNKKL
ncbi:MAG: glycosyl transferase [Bacteroidetes bacterium 4572_77]|nr:MAG: glycosyl transferase [Bacteroidetes bacterium 4572_77]